jgi:PTS system ascorbate-specific IIA component
MIEGFELTKEFINFHPGNISWEEAIEFSAKPLLEKGYVKRSYVDAMVDTVKNYGPYIVIAPNIAMPHARPEAGSNKVGYTVTLFENSISFGETPDLNARLFVALSCADSDTHLKMMQALVGVLGDDEKFSSILNAKTKEEILYLFK